MPRASGFTLIELMFVVALVAVLLTMGAPALQTMIINNRISTAASDLMSDLTFARATAISRTQRVGVCASSNQTSCTGDWNQGWIIYVDANGNNAFDTASETIVRVREALAAGLTVIPTPDTTGITFRPSGPADAARTFRVCQIGFIGRNVALNATGRAVSTPTPSNCT